MGPLYTAMHILDLLLTFPCFPCTDLRFLLCMYSIEISERETYQAYDNILL